MPSVTLFPLDFWSGYPATDDLAGLSVFEGPFISFGIRRYAQEREQSKPRQRDKLLKAGRSR
jgi:hypothetical protein